MPRTSSKSAAKAGGSATRTPAGSRMRLYSILNSATVGIGELCQGGRACASRMVMARQIGRRLHFHQPARRALELEAQPLAAVELSRRSPRRQQGLDAAV